MERVGIIDLGSNTVRLVVYDVQKHILTKKRPKGSDFTEILNEKSVAGLSAYVVDGKFSDDGIERAGDVLTSHIKSARNVNCKRIQIFATAVLRNCTNSKQVIKELQNRTGHNIDLISGEEEAHLGFVGASIAQKIEDGVLVDIGGGSTEITLIENGDDGKRTSLPQGSVSSYAEFVSLILPQPKECDAITKMMREYASALPFIKKATGLEMYGVGGSIRAVSKLCGRHAGAARGKKTFTLVDVDEVLELLDRDPSTLAHLAVKAAPERLHSVMPGCLILAEIMRETNAPSITVCKYGVREGYLLERVMS